MSKVAVTVVTAPRVTVHGPVPVQAPPLQPVKTEPASGAAVSVTSVPLLPVAALLTVGREVGLKVAVTVVAAANVTVHGPVPVQAPPLQPVKAEPVVGAAVSVTGVPLG